MSTCPYCDAPLLERESDGIWLFCRHCLAYRTSDKYKGKWQRGPHSDYMVWSQGFPVYQYEGLTELEHEIIRAHSEEMATVGHGIDTSTISTIAEEFEGGTTISEIAKTHSMSRHSISGLLKGLGFSVRRGRPLGKDKENTS